MHPGRAWVPYASQILLFSRRRDAQYLRPSSARYAQARPSPLIRSHRAFQRPPLGSGNAGSARRYGVGVASSSRPTVNYGSHPAHADGRRCRQPAASVARSLAAKPRGKGRVYWRCRSTPCRRSASRPAPAGFVDCRPRRRTNSQSELPGPRSIRPERGCPTRCPQSSSQQL